MSTSLRSYLRLVILTLVTGISTLATGLITAASALQAAGVKDGLDPLSIKIAIAGAVVAMCTSLSSGLSEPPKNGR